MAPEMLLEQPYNYSVDWWALGVTLFTMLKAMLPFDGGRRNHEEKMMRRIVKSRPRYDPTWSQPMCTLLRSLLQKLPKLRICSLRQIRQSQLYNDMDWKALEEERLHPPCVHFLTRRTQLVGRFQPRIKCGDDTVYIPAQYREAPLPARSAVPYKKGDSMRTIFRNFSHRASFESSFDSTNST